MKVAMRREMVNARKDKCITCSSFTRVQRGYYMVCTKMEKGALFSKSCQIEEDKGIHKPSWGASACSGLAPQ
jgi:hypothetical protein